MISFRAAATTACFCLVLSSLGCTAEDGEAPANLGNNANGSPNGSSNQTPNNNQGGENNDPNVDANNNDDDDRPEPGNGDDFDWDDEDFAISAVIPPQGPLEGGTEVRVTGHDLSEGTELRFGSQSVDTELSEGQLVATTPPSDSSGPVMVRAISPGGQISELANGFTYADPTAVDDWFPSVAPSTGGVELTLIGEGFSDPTGISFDGQSAASIDVVNDEQIRAKLPPLPAGPVDIRITTESHQIDLPDALTIFDPISIKGVTPTVGHPDGGDTLVIEASGLTDDVDVQLGDQLATVDAVDTDAGTIHVTTPSSDPGAVDIRVLNDFAIDRIPQGFLYDADDQPFLHSLSPSVASTDGDSEHVLSGQGLDDPDATVEVDGIAATIIDASANTLDFKAPPRPPGPASVELFVGAQLVDTLDDALHYLDPIELLDLTPASGSSDGGDTLTMTGEGLDQIDAITLGASSASFDILDDQTLEITTPSHEPGTVDLHATDTAGRTHTLEQAFHFRSAPEVWGIDPGRGSIAGNTFVTLYGRGFDDSLSVFVDDNAATDIRSPDPYSLSFRTPPASSSGEVDITIDDGTDTVVAPHPFIYFNPTSSFGGAWGPPVTGSMNITVINADGSPVPGAFVMLSTDPSTDFQGTTDANGQVTLSGPGLQGPQMVTATAAGLSTFTIRELDAKNLTIPLNPVEPADGDPGGDIDPPPHAHFHGEVTVTGKGSDPTRGAMEINHSQVRVTRPGVNAGGFLPGADADVPGEGSYATISRVGDLALVALCGYLDEDTEHFTPKFMAVERYIAAANGDVSEIDLECEHPVDASLPIKFNDPIYAPDGPHLQRVQTYLDFGFEGVLQMPEAVTSADSIVDAGPVPHIEGVVGDLQFIVRAGSYTHGNALPYSQTDLPNIDATDQLQSTSPLIAIPDVTDPGDTELIDGQLSWVHQGSNTPDLHLFRLHNNYGLPVWTFVAPGNHTTLPLPTFPSFDDLPDDDRPDPYVGGSLFTIIEAPRIADFDYNHFTIDHLEGSQWQGYATDQHTLRLRD